MTDGDTEFIQYCIQEALKRGLVAFREGDKETIRLTRQGLSVAPVIAVLIDVLAVELRSLDLMTDDHFDEPVTAMAVAKILDDPRNARFLGDLLT